MNKLAKIFLFITIITLLFVVATIAQDPPADYPDQPQWNYVWIRNNFSSVSITGVGYSDGQFLYQITSDIAYQNVELWGNYPVDNERWASGRYGYLRPFIININAGNQYIWVDSGMVRLAYLNVTSPTIMARGNTTPIIGEFTPYADVVYEFPLNDVSYNVVTPAPTYVIDYDLCFDFVILQEGVTPYQIYQEGVLFQQGTITQGQDFEWTAPTSTIPRLYTFVVDGITYYTKRC